MEAAGHWPLLAEMVVDYLSDKGWCPRLGPALNERSGRIISLACDSGSNSRAVASLFIGGTHIVELVGIRF